VISGYATSVASGVNAADGFEGEILRRRAEALRHGNPFSEILTRRAEALRHGNPFSAEVLRDDNRQSLERTQALVYASTAGNGSCIALFQGRCGTYGPCRMSCSTSRRNTRLRLYGPTST